MKQSDGKPYAVVQIWAQDGRIKHKTYRWYAKPEQACDTANRLNAQARPGHIFTIVEAR